jgi:hypothetical protein
MASSATLQTPYAPQILQLPACLLAYFYSAAVVEFYSALDTMNGKVVKQRIIMAYRAIESR